MLISFCDCVFISHLYFINRPPLLQEVCVIKVLSLQARGTPGNFGQYEEGLRSLNEIRCSGFYVFTPLHQDSALTLSYLLSLTN